MNFISLVKNAEGYQSFHVEQIAPKFVRDKTLSYDYYNASSVSKLVDKLLFVQGTYVFDSAHSLTALWH